MDPSANNIVEIGLLDDDGARFQTVVCPPVFVEGPAVHGIPNEELAQGPDFAEAFARMRAFIEYLLDMAVDASGQRLLERPVALIAAHNGRKFDFPFLASELYKKNMDLFVLGTWLYVDTIEIARRCHCQCLFSKCSPASDLHAHRALDDCVCLQAVIMNLSQRLGVTPCALLTAFAIEMDFEAMLSYLSATCG